MVIDWILAVDLGNRLDYPYGCKTPDSSSHTAELKRVETLNLLPKIFDELGESTHNIFLIEDEHWKTPIC